MSETKLICSIILVSLVLRTQSYSYCTSSYGQEICSFLPAPPGKTPPCALPGLTYCEHPEHYPGPRIQYLIQKWRFDHSTILIDESKEEFTSYYYPPPTYKYGPSNTIKPENFYPEPIYIPRPNYVFDHSSRIGNTYIPPPATNNTFLGYLNRSPQGRYESYKYSSNIPPTETNVPPHPQSSLSLPQYNPFLKIWKRKDDKLGKVLIRKRRSELIKANLRRLKSMVTSNSTISGRSKRQSALSGQTLCESRSQFIMPRAALNNKGNWMYVVNMPELNNRFTQLVKSETCASQTCSGLCSLPIGYTSRCEQKYVQKRLVALEGGGNDLYTDVFWFPSCCVCTLSNG